MVLLIGRIKLIKPWLHLLNRDVWDLVTFELLEGFEGLLVDLLLEFQSLIDERAKRVFVLILLEFLEGFEGLLVELLLEFARVMS